MELSEVTKVEVLTSAKEVNEYLPLGWKFIGFYTTCYDTIGAAAYHQTPHYVMAWIGEKPLYPPEPVYPGVTII